MLAAPHRYSPGSWRFCASSRNAVRVFSYSLLGLVGLVRCNLFEHCFGAVEPLRRPMGRQLLLNRVRQDPSVRLETACVQVAEL